MTRRRRPRLATAVLLITTAGCGAHTPPPPPPASVPSTVTATPAAAPLVGAWSRSDTSMEVAIRFLADGRYRSVEILSYPEAGGTYELRRVEDGAVQVTGDRLHLTGRTATVTRTSSTHPERNYADRPTPTRTGSYRWRIDGDQLRLTDDNGTAAVFARQP